MRSYEYFNGEEMKNLIRIHYRRPSLVRRDLPRVGRDVGELGRGEGGGWGRA